MKVPMHPDFKKNQNLLKRKIRICCFYLSGDQVFPAGNRPITRNCASCRAKVSGQKAIGIWNFSRGPRDTFSSLSSKIRNKLLLPI